MWLLPFALFRSRKHRFRLYKAHPAGLFTVEKRIGGRSTFFFVSTPSLCRSAFTYRNVMPLVTRAT